MIHELDAPRYERVAPIFGKSKQFVPVHAVLQGRFPGKVYVDDPDAPRSAVVWALTRWAYIGGEARNQPFNRDLPGLITNTLFPLSLQLQFRWFELYAPPSKDWEATIEQALAALRPEKHYESTFELDQRRFRSTRTQPRAPEGMELRGAELPVLPADIPSVPFIPSRMATRTAYGFRLMEGAREVAVCRSNGLATADEFMIDVETHAQYRGRGHAMLVATAFIDHVLDRELRPLWETTEDNTASRRLASRLGFQERETYPVYAFQIGADP